jgi:hypothetical protein
VSCFATICSEERKPRPPPKKKTHSSGNLFPTNQHCSQQLKSSKNPSIFELFPAFSIKKPATALASLVLSFIVAELRLFQEDKVTTNKRQ